MSRWLALFFGLLPFLCGFGPVALIESDAGHAPVTEATLARLAQRAAPGVAARSAILVDGATGVALWERDADARLPMASTTKMMTALVALDRGRLDTPIRARQGAGEFAGQSIAGLRAGEVLPLREMLYGLLLPSGNDAAQAIALSLAESTDAYVGLMNRRAEQMGLRNTRFVNPSGLDAAGHFSSARDLAALGRGLLGVPVLAEVVATKEHTARGQWVYQWRNTNRLLFTRSDATGVKTGTEEMAGQVLVASARRGDRSAVSVVLNSPDRWVESSALLDYFFQQFTRVVPRLPPSPFYRGLSATLPPAQTVPMWQAEMLWIDVRLPETPEGPPTVQVELAGRPIERGR